MSESGKHKHKCPAASGRRPEATTKPTLLQDTGGDGQANGFAVTSATAGLTTSGRRYWRSLEELAASKEFQEIVEREFPAAASEWKDDKDGVSRRNFLRVMGASMALAGIGGMTGCSRPPDAKIAPYVNPPESVVPGNPQYYASAMPLGGYGRGVLVESHTGRPVKIEGNPQHPASLGASDIFMQASLLGLYDPDRSQTIEEYGQTGTLDRFLHAFDQFVRRLGKTGTTPGQIASDDDLRRLGRSNVRLRVLTETTTSPTLLNQLQVRLPAVFPKVRWHHYDPIGRDNAREGAKLAFGRDVNVVYGFDKAQRILSLDSNFLADHRAGVRYAADYIARRRLPRQASPDLTMVQAADHTSAWQSRLYVVESTPSITGTMADHRLALRHRQIEGLARILAARLGVAVPPAPGVLGDVDPAWLDALVEDLRTAPKGASLIVAGEYQPPVVHAIAHSLNTALGNAGTTVFYTDALEGNDNAGDVESLRSLLDDMDSGQVDALIILGGNPAYTAPADLEFTRRLLAFSNAASGVQKKFFSVHWSAYNDETSCNCQWHLNATHYLEEWGDVRSFDGAASIIQPLIAPLYDGKSSIELLEALAGNAHGNGYELVRDYWRNTWGVGDFETRWQASLERGVIDRSAAATFQPSLTANPAAWTATPGTAPDVNSLDLVLRPDPTIWDGQFANNGWLQELPKPHNRITWDNPILINPRTAAALGLRNDDVVSLTLGANQVMGAVFLMPGQPEYCLTATLGYGRTRAGRVGNKTDLSGGFDAYRLRTGASPWFVPGIKIQKTNARYRLASVQTQQLMEGRDLVRHGTSLSEFADPQPTKEPPELGANQDPRKFPLTLYPPVKYDGYKWGMTIDQTSCIGCNACVTACQSENNIPVVGKDQVLRERIMHWLRIDTYYSGPASLGDMADAEVYFQPVNCMQCENAPCELVCPVGATVHSSEGLNDMTYNRCIGTRYCSNNCPYKVRRFNFYQYSDQTTATYKLMHNPEVTVRSRGVMEKCTYCVQRIDRARIDAKRLLSSAAQAATAQEKAELETQARAAIGALSTACQQACPTEAIVFGDLNDAQSHAHELKYQGPFKDLDYGLLTELNTNPRTTYLPRLKNPNPRIKGT